MAKRSNPKSISEILRAALKRKQTFNSGYSVRALARDWDVSAAFASNVLNGKKLPPRDRLEKLCQVLELDVLEREALVRAVTLDKFTSKVLSSSEQTTKTRRQTTNAPSSSLLASWMNLAVLEALTLEEPYNSLPQMKKRLALTEADLQKTLKTLAAAGVAQETEPGVWRKRDDHLYVATGRSRKEIRAFHESMILRARDELVKKTSQEDFDRRLITGSTLALNSAQMEKLKAKIIHFLDELSQEAGEGPSDEIYQCSLQLFPLTRPPD
jgi:uncharacterized protein (TIGR02147 family)